jgi:hypothetical protein
MRKECGNKWSKSWYNPRARYPMFHYVERKRGSSECNWVTIVVLVVGFAILFLIRI